MYLTCVNFQMGSLGVFCSDYGCTFLWMYLFKSPTNPCMTTLDLITHAGLEFNNAPGVHFASLHCIYMASSAERYRASYHPSPGIISN